MYYCNVHLRHISLPQDNHLYNGTFLLLLNVYNKPPHIAMMANGSYYSLSVKGVEAGKPAQNIIRSIHIHRTPSLFIQLEETSNNILRIFNSYPALDTGLATCLSPVKDFCYQAYSTDLKGVDYIFDLLPRLMNQKKVEGCFSLYLHPEDQLGFSFLTYNMADINDAIRKQRMLIY
jgi:hypothetical protein